jgi:hypothetical protein
MMSGNRLRDDDAAETLASMAIELAKKNLREERGAEDFNSGPDQKKETPPARR